MKGFIVNPVRRRKFHHTVMPTSPVEEEKQIGDAGVGSVEDLEKEKEKQEPIEFSVTFDFPIAEDIDYVKIRKKMEGKEKLVTFDEETKKDKEIEAGVYNAFLYTLRTALVDCEGILLPDGEPIKITDDDGKIIEVNQKGVFNAIRQEADLFDKITLAYQGLSEKN